VKKLEDYLYYEEENPSLKIYCGDCLEILPLLPKVDLVVTDPPYEVGAKGCGLAGNRQYLKDITSAKIDHSYCT
jgi:DNA modification methylase